MLIHLMIQVQLLPLIFCYFCKSVEWLKSIKRWYVPDVSTGQTTWRRDEPIHERCNVKQRCLRLGENISEWLFLYKINHLSRRLTPMCINEGGFTLWSLSKWVANADIGCWWEYFTTKLIAGWATVVWIWRAPRSLRWAPTKHGGSTDPND